MNQQLSTPQTGTVQTGMQTDMQSGTVQTGTRHIRFARPLTLLIALICAVFGVSTVTAGSAKAFVSVPNQFYAECSPRAVSALAPDMRYFPSYGVSWSARLYVYTSTGWATYGTSSTQTALGQNLLPAFSPWQMQESATWSYLPRGRYYQVRVTAGWFGASSYLANNVAVPHQLAQGNFNLIQKQYSTTGYCYIP